MHWKAQGRLEHVLVAQLCPEAQNQTRHPAIQLASQLEPPARHEQIHDRHLEPPTARGAERLRPVPHQADPSALAAKDQGQGTTAGGVGIDLTRTRYCVYLSGTFNYGNYEQSLARVHRPGQDRPVTYYHLIAENTIDVKVYKALSAKEKVIDSVLNELTKGEF